MRVLIVSQYFWPEIFHINEIAKLLASRKICVDILTGNPNYPEGIFYSGYNNFSPQTELWKKITIYRIPIFPRGKSSKFKLCLNYLSFIISGLLFSPFILKNKKYDIIFIYGVSPILQSIPAIFLGWLKKTPVVLWVQDLWPESLSAIGAIKSIWLLKVLEIVVSYIYSHCDLILTQSKAFIYPVSKLALNTKVLYHPNSVNSIFFKPKKLVESKINTLTSEFTVVFAGNIGQAQSLETIVSAAVELLPYQNIKIIFIGSGSKLDWLTKEIEKKCLVNVFIEGKRPFDEMPFLLGKASVLLVSLANNKIFNFTVPNKIQAYLAVGKPIIGCLNGEGARIIVEAKAGLTVPAEDAKSLAKAILKIYRMTDEERFQLGENGRDFFKKNFHPDFLIDNLIQHFESLAIKEKK